MNRVLALTVVAIGVAAVAIGDEPIQVESREDYIAEYPVSASNEALAEYTRAALLNNAGLRAAFDQWRASLERAPQVGALPDPMLSFTYFVEEIETRTGPQEARVELSQRFPWIGKLRHQARIADDQAESAWWLVEARILEVRRDVALAFAEYADLAQRVRILRENLQLLKDLEPIVQRLIQTGRPQADLLRLQVEIGKVENDLESHLDRRSSVSARLRAVMNAESAGEPLPWPEPLSPGTQGYDVDALRPLVLNSNPYLIAMAHEIDAADSRIGLAQAAGRPDFTVGMSYIETGSSVLTPSPSDSGDDPIAVTLGLSLPIGRGKYRAGMREAHALKSAALRDRNQFAHDLQWRLEQTLYELDDAARQVSLFRDTLISRGRQALELTEIGYESGTASLLDVIDSQRDLLEFSLSFWRAVRQYHQKHAELEALCGGTLP